MMTKLWMEHRFNTRVIKKCMYSAKSYKIIFMNTSVGLHRLCHKTTWVWLIWLPEWLDQWDQQRKEDVPLHGYAQRWIQCTKTMMAETRADAKTTHTHKKVWINSDPSCCDDTTPTMESWKPPCGIWLVPTLARYLTVCAFLHACVSLCVGVWYLRLDLLDSEVSPAMCSVVQVGLTQFLCVKLAMLWTDLAVEVSLCRVVVITQLDRIRHWLTWQ